jgi:hypothetical protein
MSAIYALNDIDGKAPPQVLWGLLIGTWDLALNVDLG